MDVVQKATLFIVLSGVVALAVWPVGSIVLRVGGMAMFLLGVVSVVTTTSARMLLPSLVFTAMGLVAWLAGHWLFAYRHHYYRGPLVRRLFQQVLPRWADCTRNWVLRVEQRPSGMPSSDHAGGHHL